MKITYNNTNRTRNEKYVCVKKKGKAWGMSLTPYTLRKPLNQTLSHVDDHFLLPFIDIVNL